jgi:phosphoribosylanthranilate isomerase
MPTQIKICGLSTPETLDAAVNAGASHVGLVHFAKSPRHVSLETAAELRARVPDHVSTVVLVVDPDEALLGAIVGKVRPDIIQFHGREAPEARAVTGAQFDVETWKAVGLGDASALDRATTYKGCADRLLFDAPPALLPGGNGESFDWALLDEVDIGMPWGLAGGLTPENVAAAIHRTRAPLVDVSSGVESAPGVKDAALIRAFCDAVRAADANR